MEPVSAGLPSRDHVPATGPGGASAFAPTRAGRRARSALCVDDNPTCLLLVREVLVRGGFEVECAADAVAALKINELNRFELIVTDHKMPGLDGLGFVHAVRALNYTGKIVVLSACVTNDETQAYIKAGVSAVMLKPITARRLVELVGLI